MTSLAVIPRPSDTKDSLVRINALVFLFLFVISGAMVHNALCSPVPILTHTGKGILVGRVNTNVIDFVLVLNFELDSDLDLTLSLCSLYLPFDLLC